MDKHSVLVIDDDPSVGKVLEGILEQAGYSATYASNAERAMSTLLSASVDVVICDLRMPDVNGFDLLQQLKAQWPDIPTIMLTAHGTVPLAVAAMQAGAFDFMLKPFEREEVIAAVGRALEATAVQRQAPPRLPQLGDGFIGSAPALVELNERLDRAAQSMATVLLRGESGTGKELAAKLIHKRSARANVPLVVVDLGSIPDSLMESELFGYEKGAFTGAAQRKPGRVEFAENGTLFLDEVGEIPLPMQMKVLRLLQEREYRPLGAAHPRRANVRFIAATHRDLEDMVAKGTFRQDLYYRLSVLPVWLPALRERPQDIGALAQHFCEHFARANQTPGRRLSHEALAELGRHSWPGNVRELQNFIERLVVLSTDCEIGLDDVRRELVRGPGFEAVQNAGRDGGANVMGATNATNTTGNGETMRLDASVQHAERSALSTAIRQAHGNRTVAARILGISRRSLYNKLAEHGIE